MKILIAEDDLTSRSILTTILRKWGYDPIAVTDGRKALEIIMQTDAPRLILLDWNMPNMNGLQFLKKVRENNTTTQIIMVTTEAEKARVVEAIRAGANNYVVKPFTPDVLLGKINETMSKVSAGA